jgi:hypothetical protein
MSELYDDDDFSTAAQAVKPVAAPTTGDLYGDDDGAPAALVHASEPAGLVSDEAKAAAKARAKQAGQAAGVAAAGMKTKFNELRGQSIGKACKQVCAGIAVVTVLACGGLEWRAHRTVAEPIAAGAPTQPVIASVPVVAKVEPGMVATVAAPTVKAPPVLAIAKANPHAPKSFNPQSPDYRAPGAPVVVPTTQPPAVVAQPSANPLAPKSFNPMSPNYHAAGAGTPAAETAPVAAAPAATSVTESTRPSLAPKSFNPRSPIYKPVTPAKSQWETEQDQKLNSYFHKTPAGS